MCEKSFESIDAGQLRNHLLRRLEALLSDTYRVTVSSTERIRIRGNCNEIELMLIQMFGMSMDDVTLIENKAYEEHKYASGRYGGYCLTGDGEGNHWWIKNHETVEPHFYLTGNGIGDVDAIKSETRFRHWIDESKITERPWFKDAGLHLYALSRDWNEHNGAVNEE